MKQLSGLDASFLYLETPSQFGHVSSLSIFERPDDDADYEPFAAWRSQIERRLDLLEPLRRQLRSVPLDLDHPFWVDDAAFDLVACRELVPDLWDLLDAILDDLDQMAKLAGV